jgi:hypothetical protein
MHKVPEDLNSLNRSPYCGDPGALVSYLYNDGDATELAAIEAHVHACESCTRELAALGDTREMISTWSPPQLELGFALSASDAGPVPASFSSSVIPSEAAASAPSVPWWRQSSPVWMQAVAATMVFAAGMAIGAGRGAAPSSSGTTANAAPASAQPVGVSRNELDALEERLRGELKRLSPATPQAAPVQAAARSDDEELIKRFRALLNESEERQRGELALRTAQVLRDIEIQRKVDMATVQQNIGQIQGTTAGELLRQRQLYNELINNAALRRGGQ